VSISTRGYTSTLRKEIKIRTNDRDAGTVALTMNARVLEILSVNPPFVNLGKMAPGTIKSREVTVLNKGKDPVSISRITARPESTIGISPETAFTLKPGEARTMEITFNSGALRGHAGGYLTLETDLEYLPKKIIRVRAQVVEKKGP